MQVVSMSADGRRAQVIVEQRGERVTRHAHVIPGQRTKFTIWKHASPFTKDVSRAEMETVTIDRN